MALFEDLRKTWEETAHDNQTLSEHLKAVSPVAKAEAKNLEKVAKEVSAVQKDISKVLSSSSYEEKSSAWQSASDDWDLGVDRFLKDKILCQNPDKYPDPSNLTDEQKSQLETDLAEAHEALEDTIKEDHELIFKCGSVIKNTGAEAILAINAVRYSIGAFQAEANTPEERIKKIQNCTQTVINATAQIATTGKKILEKINELNGGTTPIKGTEALGKLSQISTNKAAMGAVASLGAVAAVPSMIAAFKAGDIKGGLETGKQAIKGVKSSLKGGTLPQQSQLNVLSVGENNSIQPQSLNLDEPNGNNDSFSNSGASELNSSRTDGKDSQGGNEVEGGAEYVSELNFVLNGASNEHNSEVNIGGVDYLVSNYQLSQSMLSPMTLSFSLTKKNVADEDEKDVKYSVCKEIIGLDVELFVQTRSSESNAKASSFKFKGLITGVSASRGIGGQPSIYVTASSHDYLLNAAPNCRSFENKTLEEIVKTVTSSCAKLDSKINPRLKSSIPYIVQYNQTDYDFLVSLACRFGEWMYHNGLELVFGEILPPSESVVKMRYPGGNIFDHGINLQLRDLNIMHVSSNDYDFGDDGIKTQTDEGMADRNMHELNEAVWSRLKGLYTQQDIRHPHIGGAFDNGETEGTTELIENSIKVEARGKKAQLFTSNGTSKVAKLFLGQQFQIEDGVEKTSSVDKEDILQHPLMVLSVSHSFNSDQSYENTFEAIPITCDYPPYGNADIFVSAFPQRATVIDNQDPQQLGRIRVQFPWQQVQDKEESKMISPWIRISQPYGGFSKGAQFIPEVGEEVMVGFEMDNVERPYVIGTLFNGTDNPDPEWKAQVSEGTANNIKAIRTRNGHTIQFNDEGKGGDIQIYDAGKNNYLIHMSSDGQYIRIEAKGDIQIVAGNNITMKAGKNISVEAGENISIDSTLDTDINADANMSISAENNMRQEATDIFVKAKDAIFEESENSHIIKTTKLQEKSSAKTSIDGGALVEITASSVKVR